MYTKRQPPTPVVGSSLSPNSTALAILLALLFLLCLFLFVFVTAQPAQAQTFKVIYLFTGACYGAVPSGLTIDAAGNLYGTTNRGGLNDQGIVFKLAPGESGWDCTALHVFSGPDGARPSARVVFGPDGNLYGTTAQGGDYCPPFGCGTVFRLSPPAGGSGSWTETVLYSFTGGAGDELDDVADMVRYAMLTWFETSSKPRELAIQQKLEEYRANGMDEHSLNIYRFRMETEDRLTQEQPVYLGRRHGTIIRRR